MTPKGYLLDGFSVARIADAVEEINSKPLDERDNGRRRAGPLGSGPPLQWVLCLSSTADADGRYPGLWVMLSEGFTLGVGPVTEGYCYLRKGPNAGVPLEGYVYLSRRVGTHPDDTLPVYVPICFDDGTYTANGFPYSGAQIYQTPLEVGPLTALTWTNILWFGEYHDTDGFFDSGVSLSRFTIPADGKYQFGGSITLGDSANSYQNLFLVGIRANGEATPLLGQNGWAHYETFSPPSSAGSEFRVVHVQSRPAPMLAGEYAEMAVYSTTGSTTAYDGIFWVRRVDNVY